MASVEIGGVVGSGIGGPPPGPLEEAGHQDTGSKKTPETPDSGYSSISSSCLRLNGNSPVVTALEEKENYDHNSAQHTEDFPPTGKQSKRSISRLKEIESPMPGVALKSLAPGATNEVLERARVIVEKAVKQNKVFIIFGQYSSVRRALKRRGWLEKPCECFRVVPRTAANAKKVSQACEQGEHGVTLPSELAKTDLESVIAKLLTGVAPNLIWVTQRNKVDWKRLRKDQVVNKFPHAHFTTKIGIHSCLQNLHWFTNFTMNNFFPRCYQVFIPEERKAFIEDYRLTACMNVLKWFVSTHLEQGTQAIEAKSGRVRRTLIDFSIARCDEFLRSRDHVDLDIAPAQLWEHQWEQFLTEYYSIIQGGAKIQEYYEGSRRSEDLLAQARKTLERLKKVCPAQMEMDGLLNLWIIKPGSSSRGRGISISNRLERILGILDHGAGAKQARFVVQKYIERPMLIYNTKFDIRQWVLVTDWNPLVIWMYKSSYLRFCSQPFKIDDFHESIHLCNNAIQTKYKNGERSSNLPEENMWDNDTFINYLRQVGLPDGWNSVIYPGMKKSLVGSLLATQDMMDGCCARKNSYELYGADFMLTSDLRPWLLEINSSPALGATTSITSRLCSAVLEDVIKVTVDKARNRTADTGGWELVYRTGNILLDESMPYLNHRKVRLTQEAENLQALFAEAENLVGSQNAPGQPKMVELIDTIMSIPSCLQDQQSKVDVVNKWIKEHKKNESQEKDDENLEQGTEAIPNNNEEDQIVAVKKVLDIDEEFVTSTEDNVMLSPEKRKHLKRKKKKKNIVSVGRKSLRNLCNPDPVNPSLECLGSNTSLMAQPSLSSDRETNQTLFLYKELRRLKKSILHNCAP